MISEDRLSKALAYLASTDAEAAALKVDVERKHYVLKRTKAAVYLMSTGTVPEREAQSITSNEYKDAEQAYLDAYLASEAMANKRKSEELVTKIWQSLNANRRAGNIT